MIEALRRLEEDGRDMGIWALGSIRSTGQEHRFEGSGYFDMSKRAPDNLLRVSEIGLA